MPFLMDAESAARRIRRGLAKDKPRISFPLPLAALPVRLTDRLLTRLPAKR